MKYWTSVTVAALVAACGQTTNTPPDGGGVAACTNNVCDVKDPIKSDTTWAATNTYVLKTHIFVESGTLTIEPGTTVKGETGSSLVVTSGGKINATGTAAKPIVFTSAVPVGQRKAADWGGVVLLGKAPINAMGGTNAIEGFAATTDQRTQYGGTDAAHNCGTIKYARIEFAGFRLTMDNELNSLTLGGCGTGTEIDYVQTYKGADDGIEMFGGTTNLKHIVITQPDDDGLDWDFGWTGKVQFLVVQQNADVGNNGLEGDNHPSDFNASPRAKPEIWNATLIGTTRAAGGMTQSFGMLLRRGTAGLVNNSIMAHFADHGVDINGADSVAQYNAGNLAVRNSIFFDNKGKSDGLPEDAKDNDGNFAEGAAIMEASNNNRATNPLLGDDRNLTAPNWKPQAGSPALTGGATPPAAGGFFDTSATYVGAIGTTDWTAGWTAYPAN